MPECRTIQSVLNSADPAQNAGMGGHLTQHILGLTPPAGLTQQGKTLFDSQRDYLIVWNRYTRLLNATRNCGGANPRDSRTLLQLGWPGFMAVWSCDTVDAQGRAVDVRGYIARTIVFAFQHHHPHGWILATCYPEPEP